MASENASGPCQVDKKQEAASWPFEIGYEKSRPELKFTKSAKELKTMHAQFFSGKSSPFMKNSIPPELGFYDAGISYKVETHVVYQKAIDGRSCAKVVGARLLVKHAPIIYLAKELSARNCVSKTALSFQLMHDTVVENMMMNVFGKSPSPKVKELVFAAYEKKGAAGFTSKEIAQQLTLMESEATGELAAMVGQENKNVRKTQIYTEKNFHDLYSACDGDFKAASELAIEMGGK